MKIIIEITGGELKSKVDCSVIGKPTTLLQKTHFDFIWDHIERACAVIKSMSKLAGAEVIDLTEKESKHDNI